MQGDETSKAEKSFCGIPIVVNDAVPDRPAAIVMVRLPCLTCGGSGFIPAGAPVQTSPTSCTCAVKPCPGCGHKPFNALESIQNPEIEKTIVEILERCKVARASLNEDPLRTWWCKTILHLTADIYWLTGIIAEERNQ